MVRARLHELSDFLKSLMKHARSLFAVIRSISWVLSFFRERHPVLDITLLKASI
jgi:hypothetical protein